jgi:hypothetical protein
MLQQARLNPRRLDVCRKIKVSCGSSAARVGGDDRDRVGEMIDLEFDSSKDAETVRVASRELWRRVEPEGLISNPQARIVEAVESKEY